MTILQYVKNKICQTINNAIDYMSCKLFINSKILNIFTQLLTIDILLLNIALSLYDIEIK